MKYIIHYKVGKIDVLLREHIKYESKRNNFLLLEKHGYYTNISSIIERFYFNILKYGNDIVKKGKQTFIFDDMSLLDGIDVFFNGMSVTITAILNKKLNKTVSNGGYDENSPLKFVNRNVYFSPIINIKVDGKTVGELVNAIMTTLGHEFTHAYTDYMIFKNSVGSKRLRDVYNPDVINAWIDHEHSDNTDDTDVSDFYKVFAEIFYVLNKYEQNSYVAEIKQAIEYYPFEIETVNELTKVVMSTESYYMLHKILKLIQEINDENWTETLKYIIVDSINHFSGKKFEKFDDAMNYVNVRARKAKRKFDSTVSKIVYDIVQHKHNSGKIIDRQITGGDEFFRKLREE